MVPLGERLERWVFRPEYIEHRLRWFADLHEAVVGRGFSPKRSHEENQHFVGLREEIARQVRPA